jgi:hypothetical protein
MIPIVLLLLFFAGMAQECPKGMWYQFVRKNIDHSFPVIDNPYLHPSADYLAKVKENMSNKQRVCAIHYLNQDKSRY